MGFGALSMCSHGEAKKSPSCCERNSAGCAPNRNEVTSHVISWCKVEGKASPRGTSSSSSPYLLPQSSHSSFPSCLPPSPCTFHSSMCRGTAVVSIHDLSLLSVWLCALLLNYCTSNLVDENFLWLPRWLRPQGKQPGDP